MNHKKINMLPLAKLLQKFAPQIDATRITGVTSDSREVKAGYIFVAIPGTAQDGHSYIKTAADQGALLLIGEEAQKNLVAPYCVVPDSREALAMLASAFYENPSEKMMILGVTGTSGKTTTTYLLESILKAAGKKTAVIGTVNFRFGEKVYPSTHTTPGPVELQKLLVEMLSDGCDSVVMEVSSHALKQKRVFGISFAGAIFTNLSPEHLDFHLDMEDYFQSKAVLFKKHLASGGVAAINVSESWGKRLAGEIPNAIQFDGSTLFGSIGGLKDKSAASPLIQNSWVILMGRTSRARLL